MSDGFSFKVKVEETKIENSHVFKNEESNEMWMTREKCVMNEKFENYIKKINVSTKAAQNEEMMGQETKENCKDRLPVPFSTETTSTVTTINKKVRESLSIINGQKCHHGIHMDKLKEEILVVDDRNGTSNGSYIGKFFEIGISIFGLLRTVPSVLETVEHLFSVFRSRSSNKNTNEEG